MPGKKQIGVIIVTNDKFTNEMIARYLSQLGIGEEAIVKLPEEAGGELGYEVKEDFLESMQRAASDDRRIVFKQFRYFADGSVKPLRIERPRDPQNRKMVEKVRGELKGLLKRRDKLRRRKSTKGR